MTKTTRARRWKTKHPYLDDFVRLRCAPDLLALKVFPNAKEITESMAAYDAVVRHVLGGDARARKFKPPSGQLEFDGPRFATFGLADDCFVICPGDGHAPRTGALFAMRSRWVACSVDPCLRARDWRVERLGVFRDRIEDAPMPPDGFPAPVIIVAVHSHAVLAHCLERIIAPEIHVVSLPCCVPQTLNRAPDVSFRDEAIMSPANEVLVWRHYQHQAAA